MCIVLDLMIKIHKRHIKLCAIKLGFLLVRLDRADSRGQSVFTRGLGLNIQILLIRGSGKRGLAKKGIPVLKAC